MIKDAQTILAAILTKIIKPYVSVHPIGRDLYVMFRTFILMVLPKLKFTLIYYGPLWISYDVDYMIFTIKSYSDDTLKLKYIFAKNACYSTFEISFV